MMKFGIVLLSLLVGFCGNSYAAFPHGVAAVTSSFNNGKFQLNPNFPQSGGDYPFLNWLKTTQTWSNNDNTGDPYPPDFDANGYPKPGTTTFSVHGGVQTVFNTAAEAYIGNNCTNGISGGTCFSYRATGKHTISPAIATIITANASSVVSTGTVVTVSFSTTQDFRAGMEVPLSGTTGLTALNGGGGPIANGGTTGSWTVCTAGLTTLSFQLCLNDGVTNLTTTASGTAGGTTAVSYGRNAIGVATNGRIVYRVVGSPGGLTIGVSANDATFPVTSSALVLEGTDETLFEQGKIFRPKYLNTLLQGPGFPAVLRDLNLGQKNISTEVKWCDRKPQTYYSWASMTLDTACGTIFAGTTASNTGNDYTISFGSGAPTDRQKLIVQFDATAVTSSATGTGSAATLTFGSAHNLHVGDPINLFSTSTAPTAASTFTGQIAGTTLTISAGVAGGVVLGMNVTGAGVTAFQITSQLTGTAGGAGTYSISGGSQTIGPVTMNASVVLSIYVAGTQATPYYVAGTPTGTTLTYSAFPGGTAISTSSAGSGTLSAHKTIVRTTITFASGGQNVTWTAHNLTANEPVAVACVATCNLPSPMVIAGNYYVKTVVDANTITLSATAGGAAITFASAGTGTQLAFRQPTLSLNGTTATPIRDQYGKAIEFGEPPLAFVFGSHNAYAILIYDAVIGSWIKNGADANQPSVYMVSGWPPEIFLELCKQIGAMPWIVSGSYMLDGPTGMTDYMPSEMALIKYQYPSWMLPRAEMDNEEWNFQFHGTNFAFEHALVYGTSNLPNYAGWTLTNPINDYAGKVFSVLGQAVNAVYGGVANDGTKYQVIVGVQTSNFTQPGGPSDGIERIASSNFVAQTTAAPPSLTGPFGAGGGSLTINFLKDNGYKWGWAVACAQYFGSGYDGLSIESSLATSFAAGMARVSINNGTATVAGTTLTLISTNIGTLDNGSTQLYGPGVPYGTTISGTSPNFVTSVPVLLGDSGINNLLFVQSTSVASSVTQWIDSTNYDATFTGTISGNQLTVTGVSGYIIPNTSSVGGIVLGNGFGDVLAPAAGIPDLTYVSTQLTGTPNGNGTYQMSASLASQGPVTMHTSGLFGIPSIGTAYRAVAALANGTAQSGGGWGGGTYHLHMTGYEGGYSPGQNNSLLPFWQYGKYVVSTPNAVKGLETYVTQNCVNFQTAGGDYCSLFQFTGNSVNTAPWDALNDIYQPGPTPYWNGYLNLPFLLERDINPASNDNTPMFLEKVA